MSHPTFENHDPGHYMDEACSVLIAYDGTRSSNWAYYGAPHGGPMGGSVQSRAIAPGCRSTRYGDRFSMLGELRRRPYLTVTEEGMAWLYPDPPLQDGHSAR